MRRREPIYGLDLIRFLSALFVLAWHLGYRFLDSRAPHIRTFVSGVPAEPHDIQNYARWGWIGVEVFFVISGLVIAYSARNSGPARFFFGRVGRLVPGVLLCTLLIACIDLFFWNDAIIGIVKQTIKTMIFWPMGGWIAPQFWTLPVEVAFYGVVWLLILSGAIRHLDRLALILLGISALYWAAIYLDITKMRWPLDCVLLLQHGLYFALGICLASIDREGASPLRLFVVAGAIILAGFEIAFAMTKYSVASSSQPALWIVPYAIWLALLALIMASLRWKGAIALLVTRLKLGTTLQMLGLATFPLYLIHIHLGGFVTTVAISSGITVMPALALGALACIPVSVLIAVSLEPPVRALILRPFRNWLVPATASSPSNQPGVPKAEECPSPRHNHMIGQPHVQPD